MRHLLFALCLSVFAVTLASGQQPTGSVLEHYRAYNAALERNDLVAAEAAAEAALAASEARDGDGGRTAVLALNLATVRLMAGDREGAVGPAARALTLAQAGAAGVDALSAELILGRAELATRGSAGAERLERVLARADVFGLPRADIYSATVELGAWAIREENYRVAERAWDTAAAHADGSAFGAQMGLGRARTWQAATMVLAQVGPRGRLRLDDETVARVASLLADALGALRPLATQDVSGAEVTHAQQAYAEAMVWWHAVSAKLRSEGREMPRTVRAQNEADSNLEIGPIDLTLPRCLIRFTPRADIEYPAEEVIQGNIGKRHSARARRFLG